MNIITKSFSILTFNQRKHLFLLFIFVIITIFLETLSIGLIIPIVTLLVNFEKLMSYEVVNSLLNYIQITNQKKIILLGLFILLFVYTIKNIYLAFFIYIQARFSFKISLNLSEKLFFSYLNQPYTFHLQINSSELIRNISGESKRAVESIMGIITLLTESLILTFILILLIYVQPEIAMITILVMGLAALISNTLTSKPIKKIGDDTVIYSARVLRNLMQGLNSIKETLLMWKQKSFINQFHDNQLKLLDSARRLNFITSLPRLWLEILALSGLSIIIVIMLTNNQPINNIIPTLTLFAAAAFRLMPCISKILQSLQVLKYCKPAVNIIYNELNSNFFKEIYIRYEEENNSEIKLNSLMKSKSVIKMKNISFLYPNSNKIILDNININLTKGNSIGIVGSSGAGKSTLVNLFLGLLKPTSGEILIDNYDINSKLKQWQTNIGYVPQFVYLTDDSILRNIAFGVRLEDIDNKRINIAIEQAQLKDFIKTLPKGLNTIIGEDGARISGGERQRIGIARSLYNDPDILVFDEATSSLDSETERKFVEVIRNLQSNKTIIIISHRFTTVQYCKKILTIKNGKVYED